MAPKRGNMNKPTIAKNTAIEVHQVVNGFIVKLPYMMAQGEPQPIEASMVFESFSALSAWMAQHFSFSDAGVQSDA